MERLRSMSPEEVFQTAVDAGIYTPDGKLTSPYRQDPCSVPPGSLYTGAHDSSDS